MAGDTFAGEIFGDGDTFEPGDTFAAGDAPVLDIIPDLIFVSLASGLILFFVFSSFIIY
jgi:hypothetical protein